MCYSEKLGIVGVGIDSADTLILIVLPFDLKVALIAPGGVPGVLEDPVAQARSVIMAITNNEHCMVDLVVLLNSAPADATIRCINNSVCIGVYVLIVCCNSNGNGLF